MTLRVAVDFGTSSTCVVASMSGRDPQVVVVDGQPLLSSAVFAASDGTLFVGQEAERQAAVDPSRFEPHPKRRIDEGELLLGDTVLTVVDVVHAVLARAVSEARRLASQSEVELLVLTHPADWGAVRTRLLRQAAGKLAYAVTLVPEPVAAAVFHAATFAPSEVRQDRTVEFSGSPGDTLAVLDLGGGTVDASVVRRVSEQGRAGFEVLATRGDPGFGGADIDQALLEYVGSLVSDTDDQAWGELVRGRELADRRRRRVLRQDVRGAKETLSRHAYTDVPMPTPFADAHVTREALERLIGTPLGRAVDLTVSTIEAAAVRARQLTAIFLVGGSSRIPIVSRLVHERTGVVPTTLDQPETVVARGALRAVQVLPDRTGVLPGQSQSHRRPDLAGDHRTEMVSRGMQAPSPQTPADHAPYPARSPHPQHPQNPPPGSVPGHTPAPAPWSTPGQPIPPRFAAQAQQYPTSTPNWVSPSLHSGPPAPYSDTGAVPPAERGTRRGRAVLLVAAVLVVVAAITATLLFTLGDENSTGQSGSNPTGAGSEPSAPPGQIYATYSYRFVAPPDWIQTADNVAARQVVIKPKDAQSDTDDDLVVVEEFVLSYDGGADRARLARELRQQVRKAPEKYTHFTADHTFAGRNVIHYQEHKPAATVDWYVLAHKTAQVSVGCQVADDRDRRRVRTACLQVVRTLGFTN